MLTLREILKREDQLLYLFKIGNNIIAWGSQRQKIVALSTAEAEYIAAAQGLKELIWLQRLVIEIVGYIRVV
jgi:hypothetical protein